MKKLLLLSALLIFACKNKNSPSKELKFNPDIGLITAKASCGICMFNMKGEKCELAVDIREINIMFQGHTLIVLEMLILKMAFVMQ